MFEIVFFKILNFFGLKQYFQIKSTLKNNDFVSY